MKMRIICTIVLTLFVSLNLLAGSLAEEVLSAWIRIDTDLTKGQEVTGRCIEVFLSKGNFAPFDIYYFDTGNGLYQEAGATIGFRASRVFGLDLWALPYFVAASEADYFGPCLWVSGGWGRVKLNSLPMFYFPFEKEGIKQFSTSNTYLNYEINNWFQVGLGGKASWIDGNQNKWSYQLGPDVKIKDPLTILPVSKGDFIIRVTWDQDGKWRLFFRETFTF